MRNNLTNNPYIKDLLAQPDALRETLETLGHTTEVGDIPERLSTGKLKQIVLTGMGSSFYALYPLLLALIEFGIPAHLIETAELIHYAKRLITPQTLLIVVSQSGRSAEILRLLELNNGVSSIIAVTNTPGSPLANAADHLIITKAGEEHSVSCKTYITALVALAWLGDALTNHSTESTIEQLQQAPPWIADYLSHWQTHLKTLSNFLAHVQHLTIVGRGPSLSAVYTGALIIKEAARFPAEGMSSAAFRHGPMEMVNSKHFVLIFAGQPQTQRLNRNLAQDIQRIGGQAKVVDSAASEEVFAIPPIPAVALPLVEILPCQMLSLAFAQLNDHEAGIFSHAKKVTTME